MMVFQGQHIIGSIIDGRLCDGSLTTHRIDGHHRPVQVEQGEQVRNGGHLIGFLGDGLLR
mgnify:CR=1 FL=1